uniref:Uncharacterized protein n=1 Tax=Arundo donax TaxID=35708 RepID=A0A0A9FH43_ARUDO
MHRGPIRRDGSNGGKPRIGTVHHRKAGWNVDILTRTEMTLARMGTGFDLLW